MPWCLKTMKSMRAGCVLRSVKSNTASTKPGLLSMVEVSKVSHKDLPDLVHQRDQMAADRMFREAVKAVARGDYRCAEFFNDQMIKIALKYIHVDRDD